MDDNYIHLIELISEKSGISREDIERKITSILKIISASRVPVGSKEISQKLRSLGIDLTERAIRCHLKIMDERGLTEGKWKEGRTITRKGKEELGDSLVSDKVGFIYSKIETMAYRMDFDLKKAKGKVILNISFIPRDKFRTALQVIS